MLHTYDNLDSGYRVASYWFVTCERGSVTISVVVYRSAPFVKDVSFSLCRLLCVGEKCFNFIHV